jgi:protein phosphatase
VPWRRSARTSNGGSPARRTLYLICSDGLHGELDHDEIVRTLRSFNPSRLDTGAELLIRRANEKGGRDNVTVILVRCS